MARITTYEIDSNISPLDKLLGVDADDNGTTKNFLIEDIVSYIEGNLELLPFADDAAAGVGNIPTGRLYQTSGDGSAPLDIPGLLMVKQ